MALLFREVLDGLCRYVTALPPTRPPELPKLRTGVRNTDGYLVNEKLSYSRGTARCVMSVEILPIATQQCRNYFYDKS